MYKVTGALQPGGEDAHSSRLHPCFWAGGGRNVCFQYRRQVLQPVGLRLSGESLFSLNEQHWDLPTSYFCILFLFLKSAWNLIQISLAYLEIKCLCFTGMKKFHFWFDQRFFFPPANCWWTTKTSCPALQRDEVGDKEVRIEYTCPYGPCPHQSSGLFYTSGTNRIQPRTLRYTRYICW